MKTGDRLERAEVAGRVDNHSEGPDRGRRRRRERSNSPGVKAKVVDVDESSEKSKSMAPGESVESPKSSGMTVTWRD